jgi:hypothetical protein
MDQRLDMMKTYRVMAVFANDHYRFCRCNPGITHIRSFLFSFLALLSYLEKERG